MQRRFTEQQREELLNNKNVKTVTSTSIIYQDSFKQEAIDLYNKGFTAIEIFENAGFDIELIGKENPSKILSKWRSGEGFSKNKNNLKKYSLIKDNNKYSDKEIKKIIARNRYLEAENEFLKKLQALENQLK